MTLSLLVNGVDYTSRWRPYESRWTLRGHMLESMQSEFVLDDEDGDLPIGDVRPRKIVEVWEDASGSPVCLYRGRIAAKTLGRGPLRTNPAMRWRLMVEDVNVEVRGIRIVSFNRDAELDTTRVEVLRLAYLNGASSLNPHARDSTTLGGTYIQADSTTTLDPDHYTDTYPDQLLLQVAEDAGKQVFVYLEDDGTMELFYGTFGDSLALTSDIELNDDGSADGEDVFAPYYSETTAEHDGQRVITGGGIRYGPDDDYFGESDVNGTEATYDKWEEHLVNEYIDNETEADRHVTNVVHVRQAEQSYTAVIDMRPEQVHRIKAGMVVNHQQLSAAKTLGLQRASQVTYEPKFPDKDGNTAYRVTIELGRPRSRRSILNVRRRPTAKPIPQRPTPSVESCTRLYFSDNAAGLDLSGVPDAAWEDTDEIAGSLQLSATPQSSFSAGAFYDSADGILGSTSDVLLIQSTYEIDASLAAVLAAGGATVRMQMKGSARFGVGISEAAQDIISQLSIRVTQGASTTIRGTALATHSLVSSSGSAKWPASATEANRVFPPAAATDTLSAVSGAAAGDFLVVEAGYRNFNVTTASGGAIHPRDGSATDLPEDEVETNEDNSWIELCSGSSGDTTSPTVLPGDETSGDGTDEDGNPTYVGPDHTHSHGLLADDGVHMHDADQIDGLDASTGDLGWFNVRDFGALGDGTTDDTSSINDTIAELNAWGGGHLYFPYGAYLISSALTTISVPCVVRGDGTAGFPYSSAVGSRVIQSSDTANAFTFSDDGWVVKDIAIVNDEGAPTAGAGISSGNALHARMQNVTVSGFYDNIDISDGAGWALTDSFIRSPVRYGIRIRGTVSPDSGDQSISGCTFHADDHNATAAIRLESAGGLKVVNTKVNNRGVGAGGKFVDGISVAIPTAVSTSVLGIANTSIENVSGDAIEITTTGTGNFGMIFIDGLEVALYSNNTGRVLKVTAATLGAFGGTGTISNISVDGVVAITDGTARAAMEFTNVDNVTIGQAVLDGFDDVYTATTSTNITVLGAVAVAAEDVSITDTGGYYTGTDVEAALQELGPAAGGHYELLMTGASPPEPLEDGTGTDWLYVWVND